MAFHLHVDVLWWIANDGMCGEAFYLSYASAVLI